MAEETLEQILAKKQVQLEKAPTTSEKQKLQREIDLLEQEINFQAGK